MIIYPTKGSIISGHIFNDKNEPLSFTNIFIKGKNIGTTSNGNGYYEIKLDAGTYEIIFQYIGYIVKTEQIELKNEETKVLDITLHLQSYSLAEVNVNASAEDPAYPIMRQAIAMRKVYLFEPKEYNCNVYLKGMQRLTTVPKRIVLFKVPAEIKPGIIYLSESLSELSYQQPDKIKERMISSKVSGSNKAFSFNRAGAIKFNLYENNINAFDISERGFISPLATNAFLYYKFKLEGESKENGLTIFKIQIIPIRNNDPVFRGHIYIIKDSWRLQSTDLLINKSAGIEFVDTLYIKQVYAQQDGGVWMPVSQRFIFELDILGFRGNGYFVALYSKYKVNSMYPSTFYNKQQLQIIKSEKVPETKKVARVKVNRKYETDSSMFSKKYFNNEVLLIDKKANKTDDSIWNAVRPVHLTDEEKIDYKQKDSEEVIHDSKPYKDSIDSINNKINWSGLLLSGYSYRNSFKKTSFYFTPPLSVLQFNTVEGFVFNPRINISKEFEEKRYFNITPNLRYGFSSNKFYAKLNTSYRTNAIMHTIWGASGGWFINQFNDATPISSAINSIYSLFAEQNFMKLYEKKYLNLSYSSDIINGVNLNTSVEYAQRSALVNTTNYTFNNIPNRVYTSNIPINNEISNTNFSTNNALKLSINFNFVFAQKYISRPDRRYNFGSKYPELNIGYTKGINAFGSSVDYDKITESVTYDLDLKMFGASNFEIKSGQFLNNRNLYFMDYNHFNSNQTIIFSNDFQLLDYYFYSTKQSYIEGHFNHHFNGFILNKFPLLRKLKWQEVFTLNYLKTSTSPNYIELGAGIEHIFKFMRIDFFTSFENGNRMRNGIVLGFGF